MLLEKKWQSSNQNYSADNSDRILLEENTSQPNLQDNTASNITTDSSVIEAEVEESNSVILWRN